MQDYKEFLENKAIVSASVGFELCETQLNQGKKKLFPFQLEILRWALKKGRAAVFADTGLGKTAIQASWAYIIHQYTGNRVLILAPLCVAHQTVKEADDFGINIKYVREMPPSGDTGVYITNYEMIENFAEKIEAGFFDGIVLDESSILKSQDSKTRARLTELSKHIPYRLSCTATPSPNDFMELGNQAEFLGILTQPIMLATYFIHDGGETSKWRLKGHGKKKFFEWLATWSCVIRRPSDIGFDDSGYILPKLQIEEHKIVTNKTLEGNLFAIPAQTLSERISARRDTIKDRVDLCADLVNKSKGPFIVWCNLNDESSMLAELIPDAVEVKGSDSIQNKEERINGFSDGKYRVLITKPTIAGFGMNWQHCSQMAFVGLNDSYEQLYQAIRRCYRFGQKNNVVIHMITTDLEESVRLNIIRKEKQHNDLSDSMIQEMREFMNAEIFQSKRQTQDYIRDIVKTEKYECHLADCVDLASEIETASIGYSVFSPPFSSLYTYSNSDRDMGNSMGDEEFFKHFSFLTNELFRIMQHGRNVSIHCMNLTTSKQNHGRIGLRDFRGDIIRLMESSGFIYHSEVVIWKDPVVAMQRTKALGLLWKQLRKDSAMSRQGLPDYVVTFRKPGENTNPITHTEEEFPVADWQEYASPVWMDIKQSNTLNRELARENDDERHIAPLQLDVIDRCIKLWSHPGDLVYSPFTGIGSEGVMAIRNGRRFIGSELKRSYWDIACRNLKEEVEFSETPSLFSQNS